MPVVRVPDVLSKATSLGRLWDSDYPSKPVWALLAALCMGGLAPWPVPCSPICHPAQPLPLGPSLHPGCKLLRRHACRARRHRVQAPTPPGACSRKVQEPGSGHMPGALAGMAGTGTWQMPCIHERWGPSIAQTTYTLLVPHYRGNSDRSPQGETAGPGYRNPVCPCGCSPGPRWRLWPCN